MEQTAKNKIEILNPGIYIVRNNDLSALRQSIERTNSGIFVANENSMINTYAIDDVHQGRVANQAVDLETRTGNHNILELIELMESKPEATFFPGTLLRGFGSYTLPVMPVIRQGRIVAERIKQTGEAYVDDYSELARQFLGEDYVEAIKDFRGHFGQEPMKTLQSKLRAEVADKRKGNLRSVQVNGLTVLPVICNELHFVSQLYEGEPIDAIIHSADSLYRTEEERTKAYEKFMQKMQEKEKLRTPTIIITAETGDNRYRQVSVYDKGKIEQVT